MSPVIKSSKSNIAKNCTSVGVHKRTAEDTNNVKKSRRTHKKGAGDRLERSRRRSSRTPASSDVLCSEWHEFAADGDLSSMIFALNADPTLLNSRDEFGRTALAVAVENQRPIIARWLLDDHQADVDLQDNNLNSPLHISMATHCDMNMVELLLQHDADLEAVNVLKETPADVARKCQKWRFWLRLYGDCKYSCVSSPMEQQTTTDAVVVCKAEDCEELNNLVGLSLVQEEESDESSSENFRCRRLHRFSCICPETHYAC